MRLRSRHHIVGKTLSLLLLLEIDLVVFLGNLVVALLVLTLIFVVVEQMFSLGIIDARILQIGSKYSNLTRMVQVVCKEFLLMV